MRKLFVFGLGLTALIVFLAGVTGASGDRPGSSGAVPAYRLRKLSPQGFNVYKGILAWVPVSATKAIAFARNEAADRTYSLSSYSFSKTGVCSLPRTIATGKGYPQTAACVWVADGAPGDRAGKPYGLVFVLFEEWFTNYSNTVVYVAKFDSSGGRIGGWRSILTMTTPKGLYTTGPEMFAFRKDRSVGIVSSLWLLRFQDYRFTKSQIYFLEVDIQDGILIGGAKQIPLPNNGQDIWAFGFAPAWNGTSWLIPVAASFFNERREILENKLLVGVISGASSHAAVLKEIAADMIASNQTYEAALAPYPGSAADLALFVRHRTPIPEAQRKLDMFRYDFSLKRLDVKGRIVKNTAVSIAAPDHKLAYDATYKLGWDWDNLSEAVTKDGKILLSRAHSIELRKKGNWTVEQDEQEVDFYAVDILTGAVTHKARTVSVWKGVLWFRPLIAVFPDGPAAVVNGFEHEATPYSCDNYLTLFDD